MYRIVSLRPVAIAVAKCGGQFKRVPRSLALLVALACVAIIAFVATYFIDRFERQRAEADRLENQIRLAGRSPEQIRSAQAYRTYGKHAIDYGFPQAEANAKRCLP